MDRNERGEQACLRRHARRTANPVFLLLVNAIWTQRCPLGVCERRSESDGWNVTRWMTWDDDSSSLAGVEEVSVCARTASQSAGEGFDVLLTRRAKILLHSAVTFRASHVCVPDPTISSLISSPLFVPFFQPFDKLDCENFALRHCLGCHPQRKERITLEKLAIENLCVVCRPLAAQPSRVRDQEE